MPVSLSVSLLVKIDWGKPLFKGYKFLLLNIKIARMNIGVLGTGVVGQTIATALVSKGHTVMMGSRTDTNEKAAAWVKKHDKYGMQGTFNDAAQFGDLVFICLNGEHALSVVQQLDEEYIRGKIFIDITNPLDFTDGVPPKLIDGLHNTNSLGEEMQRAQPNCHVVKTLNTVTHKVMVDARIVNKGEHHLFICGDNVDAKNKVKHFLVDNFYWKAGNILDLGDIKAARSMEAILPFWISVMQALNSTSFNFQIVQ